MSNEMEIDQTGLNNAVQCYMDYPGRAEIRPLVAAIIKAYLSSAGGDMGEGPAAQTASTGTHDQPDEKGRVWEDVHLQVCKDDQYKGPGHRCISFKGVIYYPERESGLEELLDFIDRCVTRANNATPGMFAFWDDAPQWQKTMAQWSGWDTGRAILEKYKHHRRKSSEDKTSIEDRNTNG